MGQKRTPAAGWVVYKMCAAGAHGPNAVCEQAEWDEMESRHPGRHTLVREGIATEAEAERAAREAPGGTAAARPRS